MKITNEIVKVPFDDCKTTFFLYDGELYQKIYYVICDDEDNDIYNVYNLNGQEPTIFHGKEEVIPVKDIEVTLVL